MVQMGTIVPSRIIEHGAFRIIRAVAVINSVFYIIISVDKRREIQFNYMRN